MKLVISLLVYNQLEVTKKCIESIFDTVKTEDFLLVISDNASKKETADYLSSLKHEKIVYIRNDENIGFIAAHNNIFRKFEAEFFCVLNNDLVIKTSGWDVKFLSNFDGIESLAQIGPEQEFGHLGTNGTGGPRNGKSLDYISGSCFIVRTSHVKNSGGLFDDKYMHFAFCEDADLSLRLRNKGYKIAELKGVKIDHLHNWSFKHEKVEVDFKQIEQENKSFLLSRWRKYIVGRHFKPLRILVNRKGALGDVLCIEPVIRGIKEKFPCSLIFVNTVCKDALENHPLIAGCSHNYNKREFDIYIDLDLAYEKNSRVHIVDAYAQHAKVKIHQEDLIPRYYGVTPSRRKNNNTIVICAEGTWASRTLDVNKWKKFAEYLAKDYNIIEVGLDPGRFLGVGENLIKKQTLKQAVETINNAGLFVSHDCGLMHFAQSVGTPILSVFGCTSPEYRIHDWSSAAVVKTSKSKVPCSGCHHIKEAPRCFTECDKDKIYCMEEITVEQMIDVFNSKFKNK